MATKEELKRASALAEKERIAPPHWFAVAMKRCNEADKFTPIGETLTEELKKKLQKAVKEKK